MQTTTISFSNKPVRGFELFTCPFRKNKKYLKTLRKCRLDSLQITQCCFLAVEHSLGKPLIKSGYGLKTQGLAFVNCFTLWNPRVLH